MQGYRSVAISEMEKNKFTVNKDKLGLLVTPESEISGNTNPRNVSSDFLQKSVPLMARSEGCTPYLQSVRGKWKQSITTLRAISVPRGCSGKHSCNCRPKTHFHIFGLHFGGTFFSLPPRGHEEETRLSFNRRKL